jgi:hypothetical protein
MARWPTSESRRVQRRGHYAAGAWLIVYLHFEHRCAGTVLVAGVRVRSPPDFSIEQYGFCGALNPSARRSTTLETNSSSYCASSPTTLKPSVYQLIIGASVWVARRAAGRCNPPARCGLRLPLHLDPPVSVSRSSADGHLKPESRYKQRLLT